MVHNKIDILKIYNWVLVSLEFLIYWSQKPCAEVTLLMRNSPFHRTNLRWKDRSSVWDEGLALAADRDQMQVLQILWSFGEC